MKMLPISIILPVYNAAPFLPECIESILNQTFRDFELLIIDDGSTDNSINIIQNYNDDRIQLIKNPHDYINTLNTGFKIASGKYITRMDSDDIMQPHRLEIQYNYMEGNPDIDICGGWMQGFGIQFFQYIHPTHHDDIIADFLLGNQINNPTVMLRAEKLRLLPTYPDLYNMEYIYIEDYKLWIDLAIKGFKFANIPEILVRYRTSESQITYNRYKEILSKDVRVKTEYVQHIFENIIEINPNLLNFIDEVIDLFNNNKLGINSLTNIARDIYKIQMEEQRHKNGYIC